MSHILSVSDRRRKCQDFILHFRLRRAKASSEKYEIRDPGPTTSRPGKSLSEPEMHLPLRPPPQAQGHFLFFASANVRPAGRESERARVKLDRGRRRSVGRSVGSDVLSGRKEKAFWRKIVAARPTCQTHSRFSSSRWVQHF